MKLDPFKLERYFAQHEFKAPYLLCCSDCESITVGDLLKNEPDALDRLTSLWLGYTESLGHPELRTQIAALYKTIKPGQTLVHAGAEEAIFNFMNVALKPGDHIVVHAPYYQSLGAVAGSIGAKVTVWPADSQNFWKLDIDDLVDLLTEKTKVVVVNFPHNPTGYLPDTEFLKALSNLSDERGFVIFADEVYQGLVYDPDDLLPSFADINERAVALGVMSKTYGLAGLRIGWLATRNEKIYCQLAQFKDYTTICNSAPSEFLATLALKHRQLIVDRNLNIIRKNLKILNQFFSDHSSLFKWHQPQAGPIAFPRYLGASADRFCHQILKNTGVLLLPGSLYGDIYRDYFRIGFGRKNMAESLSRVAAFLSTAYTQ